MGITVSFIFCLLSGFACFWLYEYFIDQAKKEVQNVQHGIFGADMKVELLNDGPYTIILELKDGKIL